MSDSNKKTISTANVFAENSNNRHNIVDEILSFAQHIDFNQLDSQAKVIHQRHIEALQNGQDKYNDPKTGYEVFTRLAHLKRGKCCGSACRHCPYGQVAAPDDKKKKFNTAFYY